jgi:hypothetical protein
MQTVLGSLEIDKCALRVKHNAAYGIQKLKSCYRLIPFRHRDSGLSFSTSLQNEVGSDGIFDRPPIVRFVVKTSAQQILVVCV